MAEITTVLDDSDDRGRDIDTHVLNEKAQTYRDQFNAEMAEHKLAEMPPEDEEDVAEVALPPETEFELQPNLESPTGGFVMRPQSRVAPAVPDEITIEIPSSKYPDWTTDLPGMQILGGGRDGVAQLFNSMQDVGNSALGREDAAAGEGWGDVIPDVPPSEWGINPQARGFARFLTDFYFTGKATKFLGFFKGMEKTRKGFNPLKKVTKAMLDGAIADFVAFDPTEGNLSAMIQQHPKLANPVNEFLSTRRENSNVRNRINMALEGVAAGAGIDAFIKVLRVYRDRRFLSKLKTYRSQQGSAKKKIIEFPNEGDLTHIKGKISSVKKGKRTGFVKDIKNRFGINWDRIDSDDDLKTAWAKLRKLDEEQLAKAADDVKRVEIAKGAKATIAKDTDAAVIKNLEQSPDAATRKDQFIARILEATSAQNVSRLSDGVLAGDVPPEELQRAVLMHFKLGQKKQAITANTSRKFSDLQEVISPLDKGSAQFSDDLFERLRENGLDGNEFDGNRLALMIASLDTPQARAQFFEDLQGPSGLHMIQELWLNGLLSGPKTHLINMSSNTLANLNEFVLEKFVAATISSVRRAPMDEKVFHGEVIASLSGMRDTLTESIRLSKMVWKNRKNTKAIEEELAKGGVSQRVKLEGFREPAATVENLNKMLRRNQRALHGKEAALSDITEGTFMARMLDGAFQLYRNFGGAALMTADAFFKSMAYRMQIRSSAYRKGKAKGLENHELSEFILKQIQKPDPSIRMEAQDMAEYLTFTKALGKRGKAVQMAIEANPELRFALPFVRTPLNLNKYTFERLPVLNGFVKESREAFTNAAKPDATAAHRLVRDKHLARLATGSMVATWAYNLAENHMITGSGPVGSQAKQARDVLRAANIQENSIVVKDDQGKTHFYQISRFDGFGTIMGLVTDLHAFSRDVDEDTWEQGSLALSIAISRQLLSKTWATNARQVFDGVLAPESNNGQYWKNLFGSVVPRLVVDMGNFIDPTVLETRTYFDQIKKGLPKKSGEQKLDLLAEPINKDASIYGFLSPIKHKVKTDDPLKLELVKIGLPLNTVDNVIQVGGISHRLTPRQENFIKRNIINDTKNPISGLSFRQTMEHIISGKKIPRLGILPYEKDYDGSKMTHHQKGEMWQEQYNAFKDLVMGSLKLRNEFPGLVDSIKRKQAEKLLRETGQTESPTGGFNLLPR
mgnify:FL=1|jgi:phosphoribosyl-AMP cyclohydrolase